MLCDRSQNLWISLYARLSSTFSFFRFILSLSLARIAKIVVLSYAFFTRVHPPLCHTVQFGIHFIWITKKRKKPCIHTHICFEATDQSSLALYTFFSNACMRRRRPLCVYFHFSLFFAFYTYVGEALARKFKICVNKLSPNGVRVNGYSGLHMAFTYTTIANLSFTAALRQKLYLFIHCRLMYDHQMCLTMA